MPNKKSEFQKLPERYELLAEAIENVRRAEELVKIDPENKGIKTLLKGLNNILLMLRQADERAFWHYAEELGARMQDPSYPHSIRSWYQDDFSKLLDEMRHDDA